tara:strand:- start:81 stop:3068 length:2988 start_codon:yes stop_codon:yes gene_type:complete
MALNDSTKINISLKKLSGKAHTSNDKSLASEGLPSGVTLSSTTVFGESIPASPTTTNLYDRSGTGDYQVELVRFECEFITGTDTSNGRHSFKLKLPSGYEDGSSHGPTGAFVDSAVLYSSNGALQLVPPSFGNLYEAKPFYGGSSTKNSGTQIPLLDSRDWNIDYFNGILFQQDPPGTGDHSNNPDFIEAYLYIGKYLDTVISSVPTGDITAVVAGSGLTGGATTAAATLNIGAGTGISVNTDDIAIDNSIVATLTGSAFSGVVTAPALSGSLTTLQDGSSYLIAGSNVTIVSGSSGAITISSSGGGSSEVFKTISVAGQDNVVADSSTDTLTLAAGANVTITTNASTDTVTIASADTNTTYASSDFNHDDLTGFVTNEHIDWTAGSAGTIHSSNYTDTNTTYLAGDGLDLSSTTFALDLKSGSGLVFDTAELSIDNSIIATLSGSVFSGVVKAPALSGSLTRLQDGSSYLIAGTNITIATGSTGAITITSADTNTTYTSGDFDHDQLTNFVANEHIDWTASSAGTIHSSNYTDTNTTYSSGTGLNLNSTTFSINDSIVATLTGSVFSGTVKAPALSGSLTKLEDGTSYIIAGSNVQIATGSSGAITISASLPEGAGDITSVTAGYGISGGGNTGAISLALDASELTALGSAADSSDYLVIQDSTDNSTKKVLISNLPGSGNSFSTISVAGQDNIVADTTTDTLTLAAGTNVTLTTTAGSDTVTIASTGGGETNTSSNLGTGTGIFAQKSSLDFQFKSIKAGNNVALSSDSTSITISANPSANVVSGLNKFVKKLESISSAGTALAFSDLALGTTLNTSGSVDLFYNGQLLISGSQTMVGNGSADYYADSSNSFKFGFNLETDDVVTVKQTQLADITGEEYFVLSSDKPTLPNVRVLTAADGISISTANPREIAVSANRTKKFFDVTGSHAANAPFDCHSMNFSTVNYNPNRIDVFLNGQSLRTGSAQDYVLQATGSILFKMGLESQDIVQVVIF